MIDKKEVDRRLQLSLDAKIFHFISVFVEYFIHFHGKVYLGWSGGKDSDVGCNIIDNLWTGAFTGKYITHDTWLLLTSYPKPQRVFCNTGLEFPEIVDHVQSRKKEANDVVVLRPKVGFTRVIKEIGVAVGSKKVAEMIVRLKKYTEQPSQKNEATRTLYLTGVRKDGKTSKGSMLPYRWRKLLTAPFPVSNKCCDIFKKEPFRRYRAATGEKGVSFTTVEESSSRMVAYMKSGCNSFESGKELCRPMSIFTEADVWAYADQYGIRFAGVYYDRVEDVRQIDGSVKREELRAEKRTGCTFCMFGLHLEPKTSNNRIQRLAISHPLYYDIIVNKNNMAEVFEYCNLLYKPFTPDTDAGQKTSVALSGGG